MYQFQQTSHTKDYDTKQWRSYYLSIALTSRYIEHSLQVLLDKGKISFGEFFHLLERKTSMNKKLTRKLMPNYLSDRRFLQGKADFDFLCNLNVWPFYVEKYLFNYQAIQRYGQKDNDIEWIYQNLILDLRENIEDELELLKKLDRKDFLDEKKF